MAVSFVMRIALRACANKQCKKTHLSKSGGKGRSGHLTAVTLNHRWISGGVTMAAITGSPRATRERSYRLTALTLFPPPPNKKNPHHHHRLTYPQLTQAMVPWPFTDCATSDSSFSWGSPDESEEDTHTEGPL